MRVEIIKHVFKPNDESRSHTVLKPGTFHEFDADTAKTLIDAGKAAPAEKVEKKEKKEDKKEEVKEPEKKSTK